MFGFSLWEGKSISMSVTKILVGGSAFGFACLFVLSWGLVEEVSLR